MASRALPFFSQSRARFLCGCQNRVYPAFVALSIDNKYCFSASSCRDCLLRYSSPGSAESRVSTGLARA
eukprot:3941928-Rhodomonas_salina.3